MKMAHDTDRWKTKRLDTLKIDLDQLVPPQKEVRPSSIQAISKARRRYGWMIPVAIMIVILVGLVVAWLLRKP